MREKSNMPDIIKMRIPTTKEWDRLMDVVPDNNIISNWDKMYSWVHDADFEKKHLIWRKARGFTAKCHENIRDMTERAIDIGFRPAFDSLPSSYSTNELKDGDIVLAGTLYMNGAPVRVPISPAFNGDIENYIPGTALTFEPALDDTDFMVTAIKVGNVFISDRALLKNISCEDIENALAQKPET